MFDEFITIFKTGYCIDDGKGFKFYLHVPWDSMKEDYILRKIIKWEGGKPIIPLKKMAMEERKKLELAVPSCPGALTDKECEEKLPFLIKEINKDRKEVTGLGPIY